MHVVVTGGAGFIGTHLCAALVSRDCQATAVDDLRAVDTLSLPAEATLVRADVTDSSLTLPPCDAVVHLAADPAECRSNFCPAYNTYQGAYATANVLRAAVLAGAKRFVFGSSVAVYGHGDPPHQSLGDALSFNTEAAPCYPTDVYGANKLASEHIAQAVCAVQDLSLAIVRMHNVYGPGQSFSDPYRNVVALWMRAALERKEATIYAGHWRQFTYVGALAPALAALVTGTFEGVLDLGDNTVTSIERLASRICALTEGRLTVATLPPRPREVPFSVCNHDLMYRTLEIAGSCSWQAVPLETGLEETWAAAFATYGKTGKRLPRLRSLPVEIGRDKLPTNWRRLK